MNLAAIHDMNLKFPDAELCFVESGGDNLAATFSPELADLTVYVIDVAAGEKIPRKGGPGIMRSDLLVINKIDLAPMVGANLEIMEADARRMRGARPFIFSNLKSGQGVDEIAGFILQEGRVVRRGTVWRCRSMTDDDQAFAGDLAKLRRSIDNLDAAMVSLLAERFRCTDAIGELKARHGLESGIPDVKRRN